MKYSLFMLLVALGCGGAKKPDPVPQAPEGTDTRPIIPNAANLYLSCDVDGQRANPCDAIKYEVTVAGDKIDSCYRRADGTFKLELKSNADTNDDVIVTVDNFSGPKTYNLDDPYKRFIKVSDVTPVATCVNDSPTGPTRPEGKGVVSPGPDSSCNSSGCTLVVAGTDPATPDRYNLTVSCPELCETTSDLVCKARGGGAINFTITADCPVM